MEANFLFTASDPAVILTSYDSILNPELLTNLNSKGFNKFIAHEVPVESAKSKYRLHFDIVLQDLHESDALRILDFSGNRAFNRFSFKELGPPIYYEPG